MNKTCTGTSKLYNLKQNFIMLSLYKSLTFKIFSCLNKGSICVIYIYIDKCVHEYMCIYIYFSICIFIYVFNLLLHSGNKLFVNNNCLLATQKIIFTLGLLQ